MTTKLDVRTFRIWFAVFSGLLFSEPSPAADVKAVAPGSAHTLRAGASVSSAGTNGRTQSLGVKSLPRLQPRGARELPRSRIQSSAEQTHLPARNPALRGMAPKRVRLGDTNGPVQFDLHQRWTNQSPNTSRRAPPSVLKEYDRDKNGLLDPAEWYQYHQDLEKIRTELERLRVGTNAPSSAASTNKAQNP